MGTINKIRHFILTMIYGEQYKIQKEIKKIIKSNNNLQCIVTKIKNYYDKDNHSIEELISRKFKLENKGIVEKNFFMSMIGAIVSYSILEITSLVEMLESFIESSYKNGYTTFIIIAKCLYIIFIIIITMVFIIIITQTTIYFLQYIPSKKRSKMEYISQFELGVVEKCIDEKRSRICIERKKRKCCQ